MRRRRRAARRSPFSSVSREEKIWHYGVHEVSRRDGETDPEICSFCSNEIELGDIALSRTSLAVNTPQDPRSSSSSSRAVGFDGETPAARWAHLESLPRCLFHISCFFSEGRTGHFMGIDFGLDSLSENARRRCERAMSDRAGSQRAVLDDFLLPRPPNASSEQQRGPPLPTVVRDLPDSASFTEEHLSPLLAMGFEESAARMSLRAACGDFNLAVDYLMSGLPPGIPPEVIPTPSETAADSSATLTEDNDEGDGEATIVSSSLRDLPRLTHAQLLRSPSQIADQRLCWTAPDVPLPSLEPLRSAEMAALSQRSLLVHLQATWAYSRRLDRLARHLQEERQSVNQMLTDLHFGVAERLMGMKKGDSEE